MMATWQAIFRENYHKSLDHRSFYFKQAEKKNLTREPAAVAVVVVVVVCGCAAFVSCGSNHRGL